jgi:uncharacterized membrane protein
MHLAAPFPIWLAALVVAGITGVVLLGYRRPLVPLPLAGQIALAGLRFLTLSALVLALARPTIMVPPEGAHDLIVPVLVDGSRSMRVPDAAEGRARIDHARRLLTDAVLPALSARFTPEVLVFGKSVVPATPEAIAADAQQSDLSGALAQVIERYRGRSIAAIVVLTDGAETGRASEELGRGVSVPVYPLGIGSVVGPPDLEVIGLSAGDPRLDAATVDLRVTAVSRGLGRAPFQLRVLTDRGVLESRRVTPGAEGSPVDAVFTVLPDPVTATVYTVEAVADRSEPILENNRRSVLVSPAGRKRRILTVQGSPGYDHSFMARALAADPGLELDTVTRKGKNDAGQETYFVQAGGGRAAALTDGFPSTRESLFVYDAVIVGNIEGDFFTHAQLQLMADFVSERGGGLLVYGGKSFAQRGLTNTPLEEVLPVELGDRRGGLARASFDPDRMPTHHGVALTLEGVSHQIMRIGGSIDESERLWAAMPALSSAAQLGGPRPGAQVLAVTSVGGGAVVPLVAVQRYGRGRAMTFAGEGSWRWRMMLPHTDRSHEFFWRQSARWLSTAAPEPVSVLVPDAAEPGDSLSLGVDVRDAAFTAAPDAQIAATLTAPGQAPAPLTFKRESDRGARFLTTFRPERQGLYRLRVEARRGSTALGVDDRWFLVGESNREFADPRLNEGVLRRIARASGGRYATTDEVSDLPSWIEASAPPPPDPVRRDLWHQPWAFGLLLLLLSAEWILRRQWGLR